MRKKFILDGDPVKPMTNVYKQKSPSTGFKDSMSAYQTTRDSNLKPRGKNRTLLGSRSRSDAKEGISIQRSPSSRTLPNRVKNPRPVGRRKEFVLKEPKIVKKK